MFSDNIFSVCVFPGSILCSDCDIPSCEVTIEEYIDSHEDASYDDLFVICSKSEPLYCGSVSGYVGYQRDFVYTDENGVEHDPIQEGNDSIFECEPYINDFGLIEFKAI